jgi:hypothetical protein
MDKNKLEQRLDQIAEWVYPSVSQDNATERVIPTTGNREYKQTFTPKPDLGPRIVKFKDDVTLRPCEWCGKIVNQRQNISKQIIPARRGINPEMVKWHMSCYNCHRVWDSEKKELKPLSKSLESRRKKNNK